MTKADARIPASVAVFAACTVGMYMHSSRLDMFQSQQKCSGLLGPMDVANATWTGVSGESLSFDVHPCSRSSKELHMAHIKAETAWLNTIIQPWIPADVWQALPHFFQSWLRNYLLGTLEYLVLGVVWSYYIYQCFGSDLFPKGNVPSWGGILEQIKVASISMPIYSLLPTVIEALCERGYTKTYGHISEMGLPKYMAYLFVYMFFVEFGIYWMHRLLHDIPAGYKYLHKDHHKYNKDHTMSPFAGLAFHPIDGILQAIPHLFAVFIIPTHFLTHEILLFMEAMWTANIHDNIHLNILPFMGAGWHTIHHVTYKHNYGHYFVLMDWFYGTLISPEEFAAQEAARRENASKKSQ